MNFIKRIQLNLFQKFIAAIILGGIIPMLLLSTFIMNRMFKDYEASLLGSYEQSLDYVAGSVTNLINGYDEVLKLLYFYTESEATDVRKDNAFTIKGILEIKEDEMMTKNVADQLRQNAMVNFVRYIALTDPYIRSAFFIDNQDRVYGYANNSYFYSMELLRSAIDLGGIDKNSKLMQIYPTHQNTYFKNRNNLVFSFSRNYFDLSGPVGKYKYLGSLFVEVDVKSLDLLFSPMQIYKDGEVYIVDEGSNCIYSNDKTKIGSVINVDEEVALINTDEKMITERTLDNGWTIVYKVPYSKVFSQLKQAQKIMLLILTASVIALVFSSVVFSRQMTKPIRLMMSQMDRIKSGQFDIQLPVTSRDELGILSERFNTMARELDSYINKFYVAQIKQNEAELTALKSQIYPHFLYNTLEVIRMTAVSNEDLVVSEMIESLAEQIRYIIGSTNDIVTIEKEIDIIKKYVFLLNCRINGNINLTVRLNDMGYVQVPQLILQPIVENAYIHGLKPKGSAGNIEIIVEATGENIEVAVMDNGIGMDEAAVQNVRDRLESNESGIRSEDTWHSIGLKNVHDRLKHLYGEQYGLEITSAVDIGTLVKIVIPSQESQVKTDA